MIPKTCQQCGSPFQVPRTRATTAKYCSTQCRDLGAKRKPNQTCTSCGKAFYMKASQVARYSRKLGVFCSYACTAQAKSVAYSGESNPNHKGKNVDEDGYRIYVPPASYLNGLKRMKLHQAVCCEALGIRQIPKGVHIHHRDCNLLNNEPENLVTLNISDHKWLHKQYGVATLWAFCTGKVGLDSLISWADDPERARKLLPLNINHQATNPDLLPGAFYEDAN